MLLTVSSSLFGWKNWFGKHSSVLWNLVPSCLMLLVWKESNSRKFQNAKRSLKKLKSLLIRNLFEWSRVWGFTYSTSVLEFHDSLSCAVQFFLTLCVHHREHKVLVLSSIVIAALSNIQQLFLFLYLLYRAYALKVIAMMLLSNRHTIRLIHPDHECLESILCKEILLLQIHIEGWFEITVESIHSN